MIFFKIRVTDSVKFVLTLQHKNTMNYSAHING